jgi:hypothetical protein
MRSFRYLALLLIALIMVIYVLSMVGGDVMIAVIVGIAVLVTVLSQVFVVIVR